ncbi:MAG: HAMP domain-containing histidine kinase, partial [Chlamydiae bacterium]|nr:HAMP domain-containing histidine kinase [Chlamydiota bacterium]
HELRTPLTLILAPAESVIKKGEAWGVKHEAQKNVEVIRHNALRLLKLVNQLLDLSKIDAGKMELHLSSVQVAPFLKEIQDSVQPLADEKGLKLEFNAPEDLEAEFDRDHIEKVMLNLT